MKLRRAVDQDRDAVIDVGERLQPYGFDWYDTPPEEPVPPAPVTAYQARHFAR